ncbi:peptidase M10A and M12B, matrixin and adamalysin [Burkholderia lata]|uniref:matrixin family metalloprotease n=1 Tax=Burkholderia lata (strain ATCC 17760 / DSM 23089 / LMG 22485 / NCIMB 9086 / R18194 / 383) TaxID=482957 RepID=UPI001452B354|nr:matrixin family metalloprotease [Burkholderia lata]VWB36308.1 peptidase M10A and M12B, matrixin and adamalysin [Burkholderia lata]
MTNNVITGDEAIWKNTAINSQSTDILRIINSSPTLVSELLKYNADVLNGTANSITITLDPNKLNSLSFSGSDGNEIVFGGNYLSWSADDFIGKLSHEIGHYINYSDDKTIFTGVGIISSTSPQIVNGELESLFEARAAANNYIIRREISDATGGKEKIQLNGDDRTNGLLQSTLDKAYAAGVANGLSPDQLRSSLVDAAAPIMANIIPDGGLSYYNDGATTDRLSYYFGLLPKNSSLQGSTQGTVTNLNFVDDPSTGKIESINIKFSTGESGSQIFSNGQISSASYTDQFGNIIANIAYTHNSDGGYSANFTDGAGHLTDTQNVAADGSYSDIQYNSSSGLEISQTNYNTSGIKTYKDDYNGSGQLVSEENYNASGQETEQKLVTPGTLNVNKAIFYDPATGSETYEQNFDSTGHLTYRDDYNSSGQLVSEENYNSAGQEVDQQLVTPGTLNVYEKLVFDPSTGQETAQQNFNTSGQLTSQDNFNTSGQLVSQDDYNSAGQEVDRLLVTPGTTNVYGKLIFDPNTGQETAQQNFNTSGQLTSQDNFNTSGQLVSQDDYNSAGQEVDRLLVTPGTTNVYEKLLFDPGTGQETAQQNFNTSGQLTSQDDFNASGQLVTQENYNTAGQETEQIFVTPGTSNINKEVFFDPSTGKETYQEDFDASGHLTTRDDYNTSGQLVSQENYNSAGQETEQLLVIPGTTTVTQGIFYDTSGKVTSISNYDTSGNETSRTSYNTDGLRTEQQIFNTSTGKETERDLYATPGSSTASTVMEFASSGWESFQNDYDSNGGLLSQENFDTGDGHLISKEIVVGGLETEQLLYTPGWQYASSETFFNSNGTENARFSFNSAGQETQEDMFGGASQEFERLIFNSGSPFANTEIHYNSNGLISQQFTFNNNGQELEQDDYNSAGQQIDAFRYNAGMQYAYREDIFQPGEPFSQQGISFDQLTGQSTGETTFDPATGIPISSDPNWNQFDAILNGGTGSTGGTYYSGSGYGFIAFEGGDGAIFGGFGFAGAAGVSNLDQSGNTSLLMTRLGMQDDQAVFNQALDQAKNSAAATPSFGSGTPNVEGHWNKSVITWSVSNLDANGLPFDASATAQYSQALQQAFATWSAQTGIVFDEVSDGAASDIRIDWRQLDTATTGVIGFTSAQTQNGTTITNAHIQLEDPTQTALVPTSAGALLYSDTQATLQQTALHEIGHALGLGDTSDANSVMYYELTGQNQTLDATDQLGAQRVGVNSHVSPDTQLGQWVQALSSYNASTPASFQANEHVVTAIHPTLASSLR